MPTTDHYKGLSLTQPYAQLVTVGRKTLETRKHRVHYRGPLVICSTLIASPASYATIAERFDVASAIGPWEGLPLGQTLALVEVVGCRPLVPEDWPKSFFYDTNRWAWVLENIRRLKPRPVRGMNGLFNVPAELVELA